MTPLLKVENISKYYGNRLGCRDVNFDLYPGEFSGLLASQDRVNLPC